ncbi:MAG: sigma-70 family RNA polymerase sigma factor [Planctomycetota bacterium]|nr:sigma-70 family RNA polymerase sigma factor [Planctomycetaceae bacterium]MDQ3332083.1 sigma-70 family RNA polymerase sigma factor [Planctomycetota bacterium]
MGDEKRRRDDPGDLGRYREYLRFLAEVQLRGPLRAKLDPSDLVQQTMLQAHAAADQCQAENSAAKAGWLRQILNRNLLHAARDLHRDKRDIRKERSLEAAIHESSCRIDAFLAGNDSSPSVRADRNEQVARLALALQELPDAQREAIIRHYFHGQSLAEVGEKIGRSGPAVAGLVHRGLKALRGVLRDEEQSEV